MVNPVTKVMRFPDIEGPPEEFLVVEHDSIRKAYLVQRLGSAPKWQDEKSLHRLLLSDPQHLIFPANKLDANDSLLLEYSRYEKSGGRARTAAENATKAIKINVDQLEQASDAEEDEQDDAPPTKRARNARTATVSIGISINAAAPAPPPQAEEERPCVVCLSEAPTSLCVPCGHQCLCAACVQAYNPVAKGCPYCREPVVQVIRVLRP